ncbi:unnamed protein product, partial [marine sediment metagenome]
GSPYKPPRHIPAAQVIDHPQGGEILPDILRAIWETGRTGLQFSREKLGQVYGSTPDDEKAKLTRLFIQSTGGLPGEITFREYRQSKCGRYYPAKYPTNSLPKSLRPALVGMDGSPVWDVDCKSQHLFELFAEHGVDIADMGDIPAAIAEVVSALDKYTGYTGETDRAAAKVHINSILASQDEQNILRNYKIPYADRPTLAAEQLDVRAELERLFRELTGQVFKDPNKASGLALMRKSAGCWYAAIAHALEATGAAPGIFIHDGALIPAKDREAAED